MMDCAHGPLAGPQIGDVKTPELMILFRCQSGEHGTEIKDAAFVYSEVAINIASSSVYAPKMEFKGRFVDSWKNPGKLKAVGSSGLLRPDETFLAAFVHPITPKQFLADYFGRKCAVFRGTAASATAFVETFAAGGNVEELASATASDAVHCWLRTSGGAIETVRVPAGSDAMVLHRAGASLYFRAPKAFEAAFVPAVADCLGLARGGYYDAAQVEQRGEVETFVSRAGHVTSE